MQKAYAAFNSGRSRNINYREQQLKQLLKMYEDNFEEMVRVLAADLRRHRQEAIILEVEFLLNDLKNTLHNFKEWSEPEKVINFISIPCTLFKIEIVYYSLRKDSLTCLMECTYIKNHMELSWYLVPGIIHYS
jgi:hypothetical protein